ncbi:MAG: endonuclease NucS domain-containing protein [Bryobacteraceae bacterium]|jgi:hypothetical protein
MATEIKAWQISNGQLLPVESVDFKKDHKEIDLESLIADNPELLGEDLLVIDRQRHLGVGRQLDLLCIDGSGRLVVVELKRASTGREAIAQALDYASWLNSAASEQIHTYAGEYLGRTTPGQTLAKAFSDHFDADLPELTCQDHRIIVAAPRLDPTAERIITYLAGRYGIDINAVFFTYAQVGGMEVLMRSVQVDDEIGVQHLHRVRTTESGLLEMADIRKVRHLVDVCRNTLKAIPHWDEGPSATLGGCFMYSVTSDRHWRSMCRVEVSGAQMKAPPGELDVWVRTDNLSNETGQAEALVRGTLEKSPSYRTSQQKYVILRLTTTEQAVALVGQLRDWAVGSAKAARPGVS